MQRIVSKAVVRYENGLLRRRYPHYKYLVQYVELPNAEFWSLEHELKLTAQGCQKVAEYNAAVDARCKATRYEWNKCPELAPNHVRGVPEEEWFQYQHVYHLRSDAKRPEAWEVMRTKTAASKMTADVVHREYVVEAWLNRYLLWSVTDGKEAIAEYDAAVATFYANYKRFLQTPLTRFRWLDDVIRFDEPKDVATTAQL